MKRFIIALAALGIALGSMSITVPSYAAHHNDYGDQNPQAEGGE